MECDDVKSEVYEDTEAVRSFSWANSFRDGISPRELLREGIERSMTSTPLRTVELPLLFAIELVVVELFAKEEEEAIEALATELLRERASTAGAELVSKNAFNCVGVEAEVSARDTEADRDGGAEGPCVEYLCAERIDSGVVWREGHADEGTEEGAIEDNATEDVPDGATDVDAERLGAAEGGERQEGGTGRSESPFSRSRRKLSSSCELLGDLSICALGNACVVEDDETPTWKVAGDAASNC